MPRDRKNPATRKIRKTEIAFNCTLTAEQKEAKAIALDNQVVIFTGKPGTSKTFLNCNIALDLLISNRVGKILVTRPTVIVGSGEGMGFLPGEAFSMKEGKMGPYLTPILQAMIDLKGEATIMKMLENNEIEVAPIDFVRGRNFKDCVVIVDEAQNLNVDQLKALTTRICENAKMLFTCDVNQVDLKAKHTSAARFFEKIASLKGVEMVELHENFRSPLAIEIMEMIDREAARELNL